MLFNFLNKNKSDQNFDIVIKVLAKHAMHPGSNPSNPFDPEDIPDCSNSDKF